MSIIKGKDVNILIDNTIVAVAKSCDITMTNETQEISSPLTGKWRKYKSGRSSWTISISRFVQTVTSDLDLVGKAVTVKVNQVVSGSSVTKMSGSAIVTQCQSSYQVGSMATGSMTLQGSGALSK